MDKTAVVARIRKESAYASNRSKVVKPMGTKDTITKDYMADNRVFADVFNHMLYKGKNVIDPDTLHPLDTTALAVPYGSGTSEIPGRIQIS